MTTDIERTPTEGDPEIEPVPVPEEPEGPEEDGEDNGEEG